MRKWLLAVILFFYALTQASAQFDVHYTHYWKMLNFYNPAGAGAEKEMLFYAAYSNQLTGFENSPKSMLLNLDTPLPYIKGDHNIGVGVINDEIGLFSNQHLYLNYAFGFKMFNGRFTAGGQLGLVNITFNNSDIDLGGGSNDPAFPSGNANGNKLDFGAGILYQHRYFYVGASGIHINAPLVEIGERNEIKISPLLNFMAGGNIPVKNTLLTVQPTMQVMTDLVAWRADISARATYSYDGKEFYGGVTYSPCTSVALFLGMEMMNISLSYGYEIFTSGIGAANGNHDIFLGYKIDLGSFKKGKNKHNSIRILQ